MLWLKSLIKSFFGFNIIYTCIIAFIIFAGLYWVMNKRKVWTMERMLKKEIFHGLELTFYLALLINGTLLNRDVGNKFQMELMPFWSYRKFLLEWDIEMASQMISNVLIFIPWPILWGKIFSTLRRFRWAVGSAFVFSACIEVTQLVFKLGLFEFDDMFHNTLGAVIGYSILKLYKMHKQKGIEE